MKTKILCPNCEEEITCWCNKATANERKRIIKIIGKWDVEPCCHGIMQEELIEEIKGEEK